MQKNKILEHRIGLKLVQTGMLSRVFALQTFAENKLSISPEQFTVLATLIEQDGLYQRQISAITLKDRPNITRIINILENDGLVKRLSDVNGRKIFKIFITEKGREVFEQSLPTMYQIWKETVEGIDDDTLETCLSALNKIRENLKSKVNMQI